MSLVDRFVIGVDIQRYSTRILRRQGLLRERLDRILTTAADKAGISRTEWHRMDTGDGELAVLPADVDLLAVVRRFVSELDLLLADHNEDYVQDAGIRLRVAMHSGVLTPAPHGYTGPALIDLQRLLDSAPVRGALADVPEANLAQIISSSVYKRAVVPELDGLRRRQFREVRVDVKEFHEIAYLYVPNGWPEARQPAFEPARPPFPIAVGQPTPPREKPTEKVATPIIQLPESHPEPQTLTPELRALLHEIRHMLARDMVEQADRLTTIVLLRSVGQASKGWLPESNGHEISADLLTEIDVAWAAFSSGAWGFHAQRQYASLDRSSFHALSRKFGWRGDQDDAIPQYSTFVQRASRHTPFYPTLRDPQREDQPNWYDEWRTTVLSVHARLRSWEH